MLHQGHSGTSDATTSHANDEKAFDQSLTHSACDAAAAAADDDDDDDDGDATSKHLTMPLSADGSHNVDRLLSENNHSNSNMVAVVAAEPVQATVAAVRCWTSDRLVSEEPEPGDIASDHSESLDASDHQLTSTDNHCDHDLSVSSNQQLNISSDSDNMEPVNHRTNRCEEAACQCYLKCSESRLASMGEQSELFSGRECSVSCSKHFAYDSLHVVLDLIRHSDVDFSVFSDASLTIVKSGSYLVKVI